MSKRLGATAATADSVKELLSKNQSLMSADLYAALSEAVQQVGLGVGVCGVGVGRTEQEGPEGGWLRRAGADERCSLTDGGAGCGVKERVMALKCERAGGGVVRPLLHDAL